MSLFQRVRGMFRRDRPPQQFSNPMAMSNRLGTTTTNQYNLPQRSQQLDADDDDIDDDIENLRDNNLPQSDRFERQSRGIAPMSQGAPSIVSYNQPNSEIGNTPNNLQSGLPRNNAINMNINPSTNINTIPVSNPLTRTGLPTQIQDRSPSQPPLSANPQPTLNNFSTGINPTQTSNVPQPPLNNFPSGINPNSTSLPPSNQTPQSGLDNGFTSAINQNRRPFRTNLNTNHSNFRPTLTSRLRVPSSWLTRRTLARQQQNRPPFGTHFSPFQTQNNISNIEFDYPIDNILIDGNISSSTAIKINEAVEHDRFGNAYYTQHYAYKPTTQHLIFDNNQQIDRQVIKNSPHNGMRYIREINNGNFYPQKQQFTQICQTQDWDNLQLIIDNTPQINYRIIPSHYDLSCFPPPIYLTACALPNDPMRGY